MSILANVDMVRNKWALVDIAIQLCYLLKITIAKRKQFGFFRLIHLEK